ncbi:MAG: SHOCT domain-containing protein, partial [Planctomycetota bacterium]
MIAQTNDAAEGFRDMLPWLVVIVVIIVLGSIVLLYLRRRLDQPDDGASEGFLLSDLRAMHKAGDLTDEEFEKAKAAMIGRLRPEPTSETNVDDDGPIPTAP